MKRVLITLLLSGLAGLALAGSLPKDPRFDQPVPLQLRNGTPLDKVLEAVAKSVGLSPVLRDVPSTIVNIDLDNKPFRQIWNLLIDTYGNGIDYALLENNVIVVGPAAVVQKAQGIIKEEPKAAAPTAEPEVREFYNVQSENPQQLADFINKEIAGVNVQLVPGQRVLVVRTTAKLQAEVAALLQRVDRPAKATVVVPIIQRTFTLSHGRAVDLVKVIQETLAGKAIAGAQSDNKEQAAVAAAATVVADARTNTLIVTGTADQITQVEKVIPQLDIPIQQVQLQVRIQSVDSTITNSLGLKWETVSGGNFIASFLQNGPLSVIFDATRSLAGLNIRATLDALEGQNLARRVADANLLVEDNYGASTNDIRTAGSQGAEIRSGGTLIVPLKIGDKVDVREFEFGPLVRLRPQITNDSQILLEVFTQLGGEPEEIQGTSGAIKVPKQTTLSRLRLKDGQTVVLGGLIDKTTINKESKLPLLGDLPLIGALFKQTSSETRDVELIVVITANIVKDTATR
jgi:general secretion pathway protein D/type IV pilus assembly protein PilQ